MKKKQIIALTLGVLLSSTAVLDPVIAKAKTKEEIQSEIESNNKKIDELEEKKDGMQSDKSEKAAALEEAKANFNAQNKLLTETREKILNFEKEIQNLQGQIDTFQNEINIIAGEIAKKNEEIAIKQEELKIKEGILGKRLRSTYMNNVGNRMIYMVIESKNLGDLISNIANINIIIKTDQELIADIEADKAEIDAKKVELQQKEKDINVKKQAVEASQQKVYDAKSEVEELEAVQAIEAEKLKELEDARTREYEALTSEEKALQDEISRYEHDNVDLKEYFNNLSQGPTEVPPATGGGDSSNGTSSGFIMPLNASITSRYGPRTHPISQKPGTFHYGTDFGAPTGTPIKAIAGGTVTTAGWHNAFGNMVVIDHGNGYSSLYAHASSLNVSAGQKVSQGQVVSLVGSTGNSTGPHLHLEMRYNGAHVNPEHYIR